MDYARWLVFLLVFTRITAFIAAAPLFSNRSIPPLAMIGTGFGLAVLISPFVSSPDWLTPEVDIIFFGLMLAAETLLGLALGITANMVFTGIRIAGQLLDLQIGFGMSGLVDPTSQMHSTLLGNFFNLVGVLLLLTIDGHHSLLLALAQSYELVPPGGVRFQGVIVQQIVTVFSGMFLLALKIVAPVMAVLLISDLSLGLVARTVPQLNVFILGFPLKIGVGLLVLAVIMPIVALAFSNIVSLMERDLHLIMGSFR